MKKRFSGYVLWYLRFFAKLALTINKPRIIGIAGTAGKSSTRNALHATLKDHFKVKTIHGNSETGIPLGILGIKIKGYNIFSWAFMLIRVPFGIFHLSGVQFLIAEMGIDEPDPPKNMEYLLTILKPEIAIYLNEGSVHTMQFEKKAKGRKFKSEEEKIDFLITKLAEEDVKIITKSQCRLAIVNHDDKYVTKVLSEYQPQSSQEIVSFGSGKQNDAYYRAYSVDLTGTRFIIEAEKQEIVLHFKDFVLPSSYQENFAAVVLVALHLGLTVDKIEVSITKNFRLPPGRSSLIPGIKQSVILDSSYNASKLATLSFLELVRNLQKKSRRPVVFLFGDMREIGTGEQHEHEEIARAINPESIDYVYCVGKVTQESVMPILDKKRGFKKVKWFSNSQILGQYLLKNLPDKSIVLVKGSQNTIFLEEAIKPILKNKKDIRKLCRQEKYWMGIKKRYFQNS